MGAKGLPHAHFHRAVEAGLVYPAIAAARQLGRLSLADALSLTVLLAQKEPSKFDLAAVRWHSRYVTEVPKVGLAESQLVLAAVAALSTERASAGAAALLEVAKARRLWGFDVALRPVL